MCNHDNKDLMGVEAGIQCRACGKIFKTYAELEADRKKSEPQEPKIVASEAAQETFEDDVKEINAQVEKPLKKASNAKSARKPAAKKTTSKKGEK